MGYYALVILCYLSPLESPSYHFTHPHGKVGSLCFVIHQDCLKKQLLSSNEHLFIHNCIPSL